MIRLWPILNAGFKSDSLHSGKYGYFIFKPIAPILLFILTAFISCIEITGRNDENPARTQGFVSNIISHEALENAEIQVLEWYESWINPGYFYSTVIDSGRTDANGQFLINYSSRDKLNYSLSISGDGYFRDNGVMGSVNSINNINIALFPVGFIKNHITNKIEAAKWIEIDYIPFYMSQFMYRDGFINMQLFTRAYTDTSFITTTIGGVINNLKISIIPADYTPDAILVKDTSFLTLSHDTIDLDIILK